MTLYRKESLETLRQRIDLVDVLSSHVDLKKAGATYKALCPFHDEKTPSFTIQRGDTHYHCFGCEAHGDAIAFLMNHQRMNFTEAVESLAQRFQVHLEVVDSVEDKGPNKKILYEALEEACKFYQYCLLHTEEGQKALHYLFKRGVTLDMIHHFRLGWSPSSPGALKHYMQNRITIEALQDAGLISQTKSGGWRDFFSDRIMIPIHQPSGALVGFSARKIREETFGGKYINTSETALFKKSRVLFGLNFSRRRIAKEKKAIIVEGQLDALRLIFEGFNITIAGQGTAFGEGHVKELLPLGLSHVYLALDSDTAGQEATIKIGDLFQRAGVEVFVVQLSAGEDPDSFLCKRGADAFSKLLESSVDYLTFLVKYRSRLIPQDSPAAKNQMIRELSTQIRMWDSSLVVHESLKKLAKLAQVPENIVLAGHQYIPNVYIKDTASAGVHEIDPDNVLESDLLRWLVFLGKTSPRIIELIQLNITSADIITPICRTIFETYMDAHQNGKGTDLLSLSISAADPQVQKVLHDLHQKKINKEKAEQTVIETIQRILERNWIRKREEVRMQIQSCQLPENEVLELTKQFRIEKPKAKLSREQSSAQ
jgi:DNA primase